MSDLAGARIVLTRSRSDCASWAQRLEEAGAVAIVYPCIETELVDTADVRSRLKSALETADWLLVTSRRGVDAVVALYGETLPARLRVGVVGEATAAAAEARLGRVDLVGAGTAAVLGRTLASELAGRRRSRVVLAVAANARRALERELESVAEIERVDVYRTLASPETSEKRSLAALGADAVWLASPSAVEGFEHTTALDAADTALVSIGPSTSEAIRARGLEPAAEAKRPNFEGLMEATRCLSMQ